MDIRKSKDGKSPHTIIKNGLLENYDGNSFQEAILEYKNTENFVYTEFESCTSVYLKDEFHIIGKYSEGYFIVSIKKTARSLSGMSVDYGCMLPDNKFYGYFKNCFEGFGYFLNHDSNIFDSKTKTLEDMEDKHKYVSFIYDLFEKQTKQDKAELMSSIATFSQNLGSNEEDIFHLFRYKIRAY